jgi:hypothetical protein
MRSRFAWQLWRTLAAVSPMPGDPYADAFIAEHMRCWRWWVVWACPEHLEGLTGLREFGWGRA